MTSKVVQRMTARLNEWANWVMRIEETSALGYPSATQEAKAAEYGGRVDTKPSGSIVPLEQMPKEVRKLDEAIRMLGDKERSVVCHHYLWPGARVEKAKWWARDAGSTVSAYHCSLDRAHHWLDGKLHREYHRPNQSEGRNLQDIG